MLISVHLIVKDGEKYIRKCLEAALNQNFNDCEVLVFDNNSGDKTRDVVEKEFPRAKLIRLDKNYGLGGGFNRSLQYSNSKYVALLCVDVILAPDFLSEAVKIMEADPKIGVLQPKVLQWNFENDKLTDIIDTTGFQIFKSRRVINRGHGKKDIGQYQEGEVFSYEGACPIFKRQALETVKISSGEFVARRSLEKSLSQAPSAWSPERSEGATAPRAEQQFRAGEIDCVFLKDFSELLDEDFQWYADDLDLGWRLRLFGWKSYFSPKVIAWHDRQTTKTLKKNAIDFIIMRRKIPWRKRMLDWRNQRLTVVKNEILSHFLKDLPHFLKREISLLVYFFFFEPKTLWLGLWGFFKLLPKMLKKRRWIQNNRKLARDDIEKWFL